MTGKKKSLNQAQAKRNLDVLVSRCIAGAREGKSPAEVVSPAKLKMLQERYSHFEDQCDAEGFITDSTHVVHSVSTPRPYIHLLASGHDNERGIWGSFWDQCGSGFSCLESPLSGVVTRRSDKSYVPTAPGRLEHRLFMLREEVPGGGAAIWHVFPQMGEEEENYTGFVCEQNASSLRIAASRDGIDSELCVYVPVKGRLEAWRLTLTAGAQARNVSLFVAVNWGLESYPGHYFDPRVVFKGYVHEKINALVAVNSDKKNRHPRHGFLAASRPWSAYDLSGEDFYGTGAQASLPAAVLDGRCRNSDGAQPLRGMVSAMQFDLTLEPGKSLNLEFLQGATAEDPAESAREIGELGKQYFCAGGFESGLDEVRERYQSLFAGQLAQTPDSELDRFFNVWFKYQARNGVRVPLSLDMTGYRDSLQYLAGIIPCNPRYSAAHLATVLRHQYDDGTAMRQFAKYPGAPHDLRNYLDCCSWIADTLACYAQETGEREYCLREEPFFDRARCAVDTDNKATLYEHARRSIQGLWNNRNEQGLCLIGHGDWNDSLDGVGSDGRGVSVWLSMALVFATRRFAGLARWLGQNEDAAWAEGLGDKLTEIINSTSWDGGHYIYAFMGDGRPVGAGSCDEGRIHLNVNAWSLFNGVAEKAGRVEQVLKALRQSETPFGKLLIHPPYTQASRYVGRIADIIPGLFENGSIYTHGQSFLVYGLVSQRMGEAAWREIGKVLPAGTLPDIATGARHQISNFTVGTAHSQFGRNFYSNFTGAVSWLRRAVERMLGLVPDYERLVIDPVVPPQWESYRVVREFRGCRVSAVVENPGKVGEGVSRVTLDGWDLPVENGKSSVPVEMIAGRKTAELKIALG